MSIQLPKSIDGAHANLSPKIQIYTGPAKNPFEQQKKKRKKWPYILGGLLLVVIIFASLAFRFGKNLASQSFVGQSMGWVASAKDFFMGSIGQAPLEGEANGWVNILLLGIGGSGHDGPYLSDTIILAQVKLESGQAVLTSIPRDYQVKLPESGFRKVNSAFSEGFMKNKDWNEAGSLARQVIADMSGLSIPYFAVIDFTGFEKAIDQLDGITIDIKNGFTDYQYPDGKEGYLPPQTFKTGKETMSGARALIYARSRHASGSQGSDFARSQRQQQMIEAIKRRVTELNLVTDSGTITTLLRTFSENLHTNLTPGQILRLAKIGQASEFQTISANLNPETGLVCPYITEETKAYVLIPCPGKTSKDIQDFFYNALSIGLIQEEKSVVWIATKNPNSPSFRRISGYLEQSGLTVWPLSYNDVEPEESVVYAINDKPATKNFLLETLSAREVSLAPPNIKIDSTRSDMVVILGARIPERFLSPLPQTPPKPATQTQPTRVEEPLF